MTQGFLKYVTALLISALVSYLGIYISATIAVAGKGKSATAISDKDVDQRKKIQPVSSEKETIKKPPANPDITDGKAIGKINKIDTRKKLAEIIAGKKISMNVLNLSIEVVKSKKVLTVYSGNTPLKSYKIELGSSPEGHKKQEGDKKTPEGKYIIVEKSDDFLPDRLGTRWMRINYPNNDDAKNAFIKRKISTDTYNSIVNANKKASIPPQRTVLGGGLGFHGASGPGIKTRGCIGLTNQDSEDIFEFIKTGTRVTVKP